MDKLGEPEKTTGPSGVIPIAVLKEESNVEIPLLYLVFILVTYFKQKCNNCKLKLT